MTINIEKLAVECGGLCARGTVILELSELQAFAEAVASEVKAENEALIKDAERYRCLRDLQIGNGFRFDSHDGIGRFEVKQKTAKGQATYLGVERLDKAIDEFLKPSEQPSSIQLEDFTLPPVNLESLGRAK